MLQNYFSSTRCSFFIHNTTSYEAWFSNWSEVFRLPLDSYTCMLKEDFLSYAIHVSTTEDFVQWPKLYAYKNKISSSLLSTVFTHWVAIESDLLFLITADILF